MAIMKRHQHARSTKWGSYVLALAWASMAVFGPSTTAVRAEPGTHATGTERFDLRMESILDPYLQIGRSLSSDSLDGVNRRAEAIAKKAAALDSSSVSGEHAAHYKNIPTDIKKAAQALSRAETLDGARESYRKLSMPMAMWATMSKPKQIDVLYCSMAKGSWLQKPGKTRNPYYGPTMLECGDVVGGDRHKDGKN